MAVNVTVNGVTHSIPTTGNTGWGAALTAFLRALASYSAPSLIHFGAATTPGTATTNYLRPGFNSAEADTTAVAMRVTAAGIISKLYLQATSGSLTAGQTVTVLKNGTPQTLSVAMVTGATQGADTTHSFTVVAGDKISVSVTGGLGITSGAANLVASMQFSNQ